MEIFLVLVSKYPPIIFLFHPYTYHKSVSNFFPVLTKKMTSACQLSINRVIFQITVFLLKDL